MRIMSGNLEIHHVNMCFITLYTVLVNDSCSAKYSDIQNCFTGVVTLGLYVIYILLASAIYTCGLTIRAGLRGGRAGPSPRAPRLWGPRGTSARGPAPCEDPAGRGLRAGNRARQRFWRATRTFWGPAMCGPKRIVTGKRLIARNLVC